MAHSAELAQLFEATVALSLRLSASAILIRPSAAVAARLRGTRVV